jgi:hypothetical protein
MPLHWTIDPKQRLVTAIADGDVTRAEFEAFLDAVRNAGAYSYRKLFDGLRGDTRMAPEELLALGARMRASHELGGPIGALAAVIPDDKADMVARVLGMLAAAERPMRVFRQIGPARKWISGQPGA